MDGRPYAPCIVMSGAALAACSGKTAERAFQKSAGNRDGGRTSFFIRSAHGGQRPCLSLRAAGAWRASARHSEQSGQILRYGLPQIKKISVFYGQGPVDGAGVLWGEEQVRANSAQRRQEPDGLVQGAERKKGVERPGCQGGTVRGCGQAGMPHRAVAQKAFVFPDLRRNTMPEEGTSGRVRITNASQRLGMSRADGSLHACNDGGPCRRLQKNLSW